MYKNKLKPIPKFKSADEERQFWMTHDPIEYLEFNNKAKLSTTKLKPSTKTYIRTVRKYHGQDVITIPAEIARKLGFTVGSEVDIQVLEGGNSFTLKRISSNNTHK